LATPSAGPSRRTFPEKTHPALVAREYASITLQSRNAARWGSVRSTQLRRELIDSAIGAAAASIACTPERREQIGLHPQLRQSRREAAHRPDEKLVNACTASPNLLTDFHEDAGTVSRLRRRPGRFPGDQAPSSASSRSSA